MKTLPYFFAAALLGISFFFADCPASAQLVQNGGFETGSFSSWTTSGNFSTTLVSSSTNYVHSGVYGAVLGPAGSPGFLSQTLATTPGQNYLLSFWLNNLSGATPNQFSASWNGTNVFSQTNLPAFGWTNLVYFITATGSTTLLQFGFRNDQNYFGFDAVSVTNVPAIIFQPLVKTNGSVRLGWSGLAGLAYQLQYKTNLAQAAWMNLGGVFTSTNAIVSTNDTPGADRQRFYRLLVLP